MRRGKKRLGEMLIDAGLITQAQLEEVLAAQKKSGLKLGQYLIRKGVIKESQLVEVISEQLRLTKYQPKLHQFDTDISQILTPDLVKKHKLVPLRKRGNLLTVAMVDPLDINALDTVEIITDTEVEPVICTEKEFDELVNVIYGVDTNLDDLLHSMERVESADEQEAEASQEENQIDSLQDLAEEAPIVRLVNSILSQAMRDGASDVHISPEKDYVQLRFRVDGKLRDIPAPPKTAFLPVISRLKIMSHMDIATSRIPQDGRFSFTVNNREIHVRASTIPTIYGENVVLRLLDTHTRGYSLSELGLREDDRLKIEKVIRKPYGMILSNGPTGSGKTTSLYAILREINQPDINIMTLEDPVEYRVEKIRQVQLNRKAGMTFASGLRSILRQDPDVIMVGEIRDQETANIGVQSALTGHRVLSTLHTNDAAGSITRLIDMGVEPFLVSSVLLVAIGQRLVRRVCPHCAEPYEPPLEAFEALGIEPASGQEFKRGAGCMRCNNSGYLGRTGVYEVLPIDDMVQQLIVSRATAKQINREALDAGILHSMRDDAIEKAMRGLTTLEEAITAVLI